MTTVTSRVAAVGALLGSLALAGCLEGDPNPLVGTGSSSGSSGTSASSSGASSGQAAPLPTITPSNVCSQNSVQATTLTFQNSSGRNLQLFWVDYTCKEVSYGSLGPAESKDMPTFLTHPWRVRDAETSALYKELVTSSTSRVVVTIP